MKQLGQYWKETLFCVVIGAIVLALSIVFGCASNHPEPRAQTGDQSPVDQSQSLASLKAWFDEFRAEFKASAQGSGAAGIGNQASTIGGNNTQNFDRDILMRMLDGYERTTRRVVYTNFGIMLAIGVLVVVNTYHANLKRRQWHEYKRTCEGEVNRPDMSGASALGFVSREVEGRSAPGDYLGSAEVIC